MGVCSESAWYRQCWPKCVGQSAFFPNCCSIRSLPPSPPDAMLDDSSASLSLRATLHGGRGGESRIWHKERWFPCEKLIDGRGSAFCKLVPHNFGQDCSYGERCSNHHFQHCAQCVYEIDTIFKVYEIAVCFAHFGWFEISTPVMSNMLTMANIVWMIITNIAHTVYIWF